MVAGMLRTTPRWQRRRGAGGGARREGGVGGRGRRGDGAGVLVWWAVVLPRCPTGGPTGSGGGGQGRGGRADGDGAGDSNNVEVRRRRTGEGDDRPPAAYGQRLACGSMASPRRRLSGAARGGWPRVRREVASSGGRRGPACSGGHRAASLARGCMASPRWRPSRASDRPGHGSSCAFNCNGVVSRPGRLAQGVPTTP